MARPVIIAKDPALEILAGPGTFRDLMEYSSMRFGAWGEFNTTRTQSLVDSNYGDIRTNGKNFALRVNQDKLPMTLVFDMLDTINRPPNNRTIEVVLYPAFITVPDANYDDDVPTYLPNFEVVTDLGPPEVKAPVTWRNWVNANHSHVEDVANSTWLVPTNSNTGSADLAGTILEQLVNDGFTVLEMEEWPTLP